MKKSIYICVLLVLFLTPIGMVISQTIPTTSVSTGTPISVPVSDGIPAYIPSGTEVYVTTPSGVEINLTVSSDVSLTISVLSKNDLGNFTTPNKSLDVFVNISTDTTTSVDAVIAIPYTDSMLYDSGVQQESDLALAYYNEDFGKWITLSSEVDTTEDVVYAETNHFSLWTITEDDSDSVNLPIFPTLVGLLVAFIVIKRKKGE